jgi:acetyl-CoA acyltransferase
MRDVYVVAVGMIPFGRHYDKGIKQLAGWALGDLFEHSPVERKEIQAAWFSNSGWGNPPYDQHCIRGQVALQASGFDQIPIMNVENACASASSAVHGAFLGIAAGAYDIALAVGAEKMAMPRSLSEVPESLKKEIEKRSQAEGLSEEEALKKLNKAVLANFITGTDVEVMRELIESIKADADRKQKEMEQQGGEQKKVRKNRSAFMDFYSLAARAHAKQYGSTQEQLAVIAAKSHNNGALNPKAQYRFTTTVQEVMDDDLVSFPLTRAMCAPIGDGAAAAILVSDDRLKKLGRAGAVRIRGTVLGSASMTIAGEERAAALARQAYERAGLGPGDVDLAEVHDATAFGELVQTENLGFCQRGEGGILAQSGATAIGGKIPINTSGGLLSRGHPIGASGLAMLAECFYQLRGEAGERQVEGARIAMIENGGGFIGTGEAAIVMNVLEGPGS